MRKQSPFFYGWVIVAVGIIVWALAYGVRYSFSVIFPALLEQYNWPRDTTAAILSFNLLAYGLTAPLAGGLVDRLGPKKTMGLGAILLTLGATASGLSNSLWHYYLAFGLLAGVGISLIGAVPFIRVITNWFVAKRGLALSLMYLGGGGAHLCYPLVALLIARLGWRGAFFVEAAIVAGVLLPIVMVLVRHHPSEMGLLPDGGKEMTSAKTIQACSTSIIDKEWATTDWTLSRAVKRFRFWALCFTAFSVWGVSEHLMIAHHIAFAIDMGYGRVYASSVLSLFGVFLLVGTLTGFMSDRIGREVTFSISTAFGVTGIILFMLVRDTSQPWLLYSYPIFFGFAMGMTFPTMAAATTDMFPGQRAGTIVGFVWLAYSIGGTIGPWLGGVIFEINGNYMFAFTLSAAMYVLACISFWVAAPRRVRPVAVRGEIRS